MKDYKISNNPMPDYIANYVIDGIYFTYNEAIKYLLEEGYCQNEACKFLQSLETKRS